MDVCCCKNCANYYYCTKKEENETAGIRIKDLATHDYECFKEGDPMKEIVTSPLPVKQTKEPEERFNPNSLVMINETKTDMVANCYCGCGNALRMNIEPYQIGNNTMISIQMLTDLYYSKRTIRHAIWDRLKHIWTVLIGKDYCYLDIELDEDSFHDFRNAVDSLDDKVG